MRDELGSLYREHSAALTRYAVRHVGRDAAEDIVASTFTLAHSKLSPDHPHPAGWLFRTARFLMKAEMRRSERERRALRDAAVIAGPDDAANDVEIIGELLETLPVKHREVLQLTYWDLLAASEVGVVLGCTEAAAWKRISRAKAELRAAWVARDATAWKEMLSVDQA